MSTATGYKQEMTDEQKERIIADTLPFIKYTAYRLAHRLPPQLSTDDLVSAGIVGLLDALQRYEEGRVKVNTFVEHRIRGAMLDEIRAQDWVPRSVKKKIATIKNQHRLLEQELGRPPRDEEIAEALDLPLEEYYGLVQDAHNAVCFSIEELNLREREEDRDMYECIADRDAPSQLDVLERSNTVEELGRNIEGLPEKEKIVLSLYYWEELTMKEIGKVLGLTEGRVCQLHSQALIRLKAKMDAADDSGSDKD